jgi:hypothetical protein
VARSADWIAAQHLSMAGGLVGYGAFETNCTPSDATCDGWDDDCSGGADEDALPPAGVTADLVVTPAELSWTSVPGATGYGVVTGDLGILLATGGDFSQAVADCLAPFTPGPPVPHAVDPPADGAAWFLVRAVNCAGAGSFDGGGAGQAAPRDASIASSPESCP